ncbi:porin [Massilia sp. TS11]|uniref:porin n=1 Tax=Massilia sp. TS11 TaxID=2908003 RepID=UPI001EDC0577|nr:porin [Massilia sp. TS11]MCG2585879.1 porin [Massilia sp. TS11]
MKKSLMTLALLGAFAGVAHAETSVTIYGVLDAGFVKRNDQTLTIGKRDNNRLGFKGVEDLGGGLKALFQLETRFEPDTGTNESTTRPFWQGQSRVGLQGDFGTIRIGRGLTALQETATFYDPWHGLPSVTGFHADVMVAGLNSDPSSGAGNSGNRHSNAVFYNSPEVNGFSVFADMATKEANGSVAIVGRGTAAAPQYAANAEGSTNPFSIAGQYKSGQLNAFIAYERNAIETKATMLGASVQANADVKLMASYTKLDMEHTKAFDSTVKAWVIGAHVNYGPGKFLLGYGQKSPEGLAKTKQFSLGYEYSLSKRTYLYVDATNKKGDTPSRANDAVTQKARAAVDFRAYSLGILHNF